MLSRSALHSYRYGIGRSSRMSSAPHILIVDDDSDVRQMIADYLAEFDLRVTAVTDSRAMREALRAGIVDLIVLDLRLNHEDGMMVARDLRAHSSIPIVMLTSRKDEADRIMGLELGADDYMTKPFNPRELLARIRTILRRASAHVVKSDAPGLRAYRFAEWELDLRTRRLIAADRLVELTHAEYALLIAFLGAPQRILSREQLLELIREGDAEVFDRSIDVQILRLRRKIESDPSRPQLIKTERGLGYSFSAKVEAVA
jgi:two-component system, OmpR family, response regulator